MGRNNKVKKIVILLFVGLLLVGCAPAQSAATLTERLVQPNTPVVFGTSEPIRIPKPSRTPTASVTIQPTFTLTSTSTPQPPLTAHEWHADSVLISMRETYGDGGTSIGDLGTTWFVLYGDGSLFVTRLILLNDTYQHQVLTKKLNQKEICQHLNTLDQIGFLDYDSSDYLFIGGKPYGIGGSSILIQVNAWKSKNDSYYDLAFYLREDIIDELYGQKGYPVVSPALRSAYYFLNQYPETGFEVYKPVRLGVWIVPADYVLSDFESTAQTWQLENVSLQYLLDRSSVYVSGSEERFVELYNNDAKSLYAYLGETDAVHVFVKNNPDGTQKYIALKARPLLPYETLGDYGAQISVLPDPNFPKLNLKLSCVPSDGILSIPTP